MKLWLIFLALILCLPFVNALTIQELSQSFLFNWIALFLVLFFVCWMVLKDIFKTSVGAAIVISLVLSIGGSIATLQRYGPLVPKLDIWVFLLLIGLVIFLFSAFFKVQKHTTIHLAFIILPVIWFFFVKAMAITKLSPDFIRIIDIILGILLVCAILMLFFILAKPKELSPEEKLMKKMQKK